MTMTTRDALDLARQYALKVPRAKQNAQVVYALDMCGRMQLFAGAKPEKIMRWLGFVQGVFYAHNIYTIDMMKMHNKKAFCEAPAIEWAAAHRADREELDGR